MSETSETIAELNQLVSREAAQGNPFRLEVRGRARLQIHSMDPLVYDQFRGFHKGPQLIGLFAVVGFVIREPQPDSAYPYALLEAERNQIYGVSVPASILMAAAEHVHYPLQITR